MGKRGLFFGIVIFSLVLIFSTYSVSAVYQYQVDQVEHSFNTPNFNSGNAYDISFGDSVNLATGNLIISATDVALPGRNGLGVALTRTYNSNIFLHLNQEKKVTGNCYYPNNVCPECAITSANLFTGLVPALPSGSGNKNFDDSQCSSWIRPKLLGRGWSMDYGKVKDPTTLFSTVHSVFSDIAIPNKGITSTSMILGNSETGIIYPSFFTVANSEDIITPWGYSLNSYSTINDSYLSSPCVAGYVSPYCTLFDHTATLIKLLSDKSILFKERWMYYLKNLVSTQLPFNIISSRYTAFTDSHDPVTFTYYSSRSDFSDGSYTVPGPIKYAKDGVQYTFSNWVQFCGAYDDLANNSNHGYTLCKARDGDTAKTYQWAENPYAGMYLTSIADKSGNKIKVEYYDDSASTLDRYSPYISTINDTLGRIVNFNTLNTNSMDGRLDDIRYPNYVGQQIYIDYVYNSAGDFGTVPANTLLKEVHLHDQYGTDLLPPTKYSYDTNTQELTQIIYPNGLKVNYVYAFRLMPTSMNYITHYKYFALRRAVISRIVTIPNENGAGSNGVYAWSYEYSDKTDPDDIYNLAGFPLTQTTVTDPLGNKVVHKFLLMNSDRSFVSWDGGSILGGNDYPPDPECAPFAPFNPYLGGVKYEICTP